MNQPNQPSSRPRLLHPGAESESISFGTWLRRQRELREISLREIADVTKISIRYLEALEQDRFDVLPAPVFARGFLQEYARYVGLDPTEVVNSYLTAQQDGTEPAEAVSPIRGVGRAKPSRLERSSGWVLAVIVLAIVGLIAGFIYLIERSSDRSTPPAIAAPPVQAAPLEQEERQDPISTAPLIVTLEFTGETWIEAVIDEGIRIEETRVAGESLQLDAQNRVILTLRDPEAVRIEVNGAPYPIELEPGESSREIEILAPKVVLPGPTEP